MVVDIDMSQANVQHMADTAKANGINVRLHGPDGLAFERARVFNPARPRRGGCREDRKAQRAGLLQRLDGK
jgi:hypothetical protein